jgi:hypothetical protein
MDCREFELALVGDDDHARQQAARHAADCPRCAALLSADTELLERVAAWRDSFPAAPRGADRRVQSMLLARGLLDDPAAVRPGGRTRATLWVALAAAVLGVVLLLPTWTHQGEEDSLEAALLRVERAEREYAGAIATLERRADRVLARADDPTLDARDAALLLRYRDRLSHLDSAIAEVRAFLDEHPGHARGHTVLLAAYEEKKLLLREIVELPRGEHS